MCNVDIARPYTTNFKEKIKNLRGTFNPFNVPSISTRDCIPGVLPKKKKKRKSKV